MRIPDAPPVFQFRVIAMQHNIKRLRGLYGKAMDLLSGIVTLQHNNFDFILNCFHDVFLKGKMTFQTGNHPIKVRHLSLPCT